MFKKLLIVVVALLIATPAIAQWRRTTYSIKTSDDSTALVVDKTGRLFTEAIRLERNNSTDNVYVMYKQTPATADTALYFEQSYGLPATEGEVDLNWVVTDAIDVEYAGDTNWHFATIDTVMGTHGRFKILGEGLNPNNTTLTIKVMK